MTGKGHLISGSIILADAYLCHDYLAQANTSASFFITVQNFVDTKLNMFTLYEKPMSTVLFLSSILIFYFGLIFPDIDDSKSMVSKLMHFSLPINHRGVTHTLWVLLLVTFVGIWFFPFRYFALGMLCHDLVDSFSSAGWVALYPLGRYKIFHGSVVATRKKGFGIYKTGEVSEFIILAILGILSLFFIYMIKFT